MHQIPELVNVGHRFQGVLAFASYVIHPYTTFVSFCEIKPHLHCGIGKTTKDTKKRSANATPGLPVGIITT
jgi:hypothetical protein